MKTSGIVVAGVLIIIASFVSKASADPYFSDADSIEYSESEKEYLDSSSHVLKYRLITVDSDMLQTALVGLTNINSADDPATIKLTMFDDVVLSIRVITSRDRSQFKLFASITSTVCESYTDSDGSNGDFYFSEKGHLSGRFRVCGQIFTIGPTRDLRIPYHVIRKLDPDNLPSID